MIYHIPVLQEEVVQYLAIKPGGVYVDATCGGGGHTRAILRADPTVRVIALDWDKNALELNGPALEEEFGDRVQLVWSNFAHLYRVLARLKIKSVNGIVADFGTAQYQIFQHAGFSFTHDTPLDMRMSSGHYQITAAQVLARATERELADIFFLYGQERHSRAIARAIVHDRAVAPIKTTAQLARLIERIVGRHEKIHPATRVFQALRIYVNHELEHIRAFLPAAFDHVAPEGRLVCISFHSLEDGLVKQFFIEHARMRVGERQGEILTPKPVFASDKEIAHNPSSRSARLRALQVRFSA